MRIGTPKIHSLTKFQPINQSIDEIVHHPATEHPTHAFHDLMKQKIQKSEEKKLPAPYDDQTQQLIDKFQKGYKLTLNELHHIYEHAPNYAPFMEKILQERNNIEMKMQLAPTQSTVQMIIFQATKQIKTHHIPQEVEIRLNHLTNAKNEYFQTTEYLAKRAHEIENIDFSTNKPIKANIKRKPTQQLLNAYDSLDNN